MQHNVFKSTILTLTRLVTLGKGKGALEISREEAKTLFIAVSGFCRIIDVKLEPKNEVELGIGNSFDEDERQHISDFLHRIDQEIK